MTREEAAAKVWRISCGSGSRVYGRGQIASWSARPYQSPRCGSNAAAIRKRQRQNAYSNVSAKPIQAVQPRRRPIRARNSALAAKRTGWAMKKANSAPPATVSVAAKMNGAHNNQRFVHASLLFRPRRARSLPADMEGETSLRLVGVDREHVPMHARRVWW